jgi:tRNA-Thr(GGU) m(6)t(6)A37 methyltransferase TsaA
MQSIEYKPIGIIHSPFTDVEGMPIQPSGAKGAKGTVEIEPAYCSGLKDLAGFSHIYLLYHFHLARGYTLEVQPFLDNKAHGLFATRAPARPNPIGLSIVKLIKIEHNMLTIENIDIIDGTPLLDIKPYVPAFDVFNVDRIGWLSETNTGVISKKADNRFKK